jgi:hypothetical protein
MHSARQSHFGASEHLDQDDIDEVILKVLHIPDEQEDPRSRKYRNIVLIDHGLRSDLLVLRQRGIVFEHLSTIIAKFDTIYIAKEVLGTYF